MKTNLSSQIKLDLVPKRYYAPESDVELAALTRNEKINTKISESIVQGVEYAAAEVVRVINKSVQKNGKAVLALGTGLVETSVYAQVVEAYKRGEVSFENVVVFNLTEFFVNETQEVAGTTYAILEESLLSKVNIRKENIHTFKQGTNISQVNQMCLDYRDEIENAGGFDLVFCEVGVNGCLGFNEPGTQFGSTTHVVFLSQDNRQKAAEEYPQEVMPTTAFTIGLSAIGSAKRVLCVAFGERMAKVVSEMVEGSPNENIPASYLQMIPKSRLIIDLGASEQLTRISHPWKVTSCEWTDKLIRRAIVWLCLETGNPILKLTNKDYNDYGLGELLTLYGSAYNVNIKIFNDLQHTITGWPGGKPNADDTYRPERAKPYPKRVIVFSPHPDDDVISMGGTLKRLVDQKHDVHVAYETSGNIAVGDEDMMRYIMVMDRIGKNFGTDSEQYAEVSKEIHKFVDAKNPGDVDLPIIRQLKTVIRQCEAQTACNYIGVKPENVHFCLLPFYETGTIKKGDLSERDVNIVKKLLEDVKPHEIFVAGDLADPHGTHRVCTDAVLAAVYECRNEEWMKDCRIWMYRGAWAEWEIDHIEMAVPISPEELRFKRNSILKHQSQMENAPFLGNDDRLFWQRAEERNRNTAQLYSDLGLACYEAIEAFVEYVPIKD